MGQYTLAPTPYRIVDAITDEGMEMRNLAVGAVSSGAMNPGLIFPDGSTWLAKDDPYTLYAIAVAGDNCPLSTEKLDEIVKGVMKQSRIKPAQYWKPDEPALDVSLECMKLKGKSSVFSSTVRFVKIHLNDGGKVFLTHPTKDYGSLGIGDKPFVTQALKDSTEAAITDYLKANFDLRED